MQFPSDGYRVCTLALTRKTSLVYLNDWKNIRQTFPKCVESIPETFGSEIEIKPEEVQPTIQKGEVFGTPNITSKGVMSDPENAEAVRN